MNTALIVLTGFGIVALVVTFFKFVQLLNEKDKRFNSYVIEAAVRGQNSQDQLRKEFLEERQTWYNERQLLLNRLQFDDDDDALKGIALEEGVKDQGPAMTTVVDETRELELEQEMDKDRKAELGLEDEDATTPQPA